METKHTKGKWSLGKSGGTVITDTTEGFENTTGHIDNDYYGGTLIAESIHRIADAKLIAAAPDMLEALIGLIDSFGGYDLELCEEKDLERIRFAKYVIKKATV